MPAQFAHSFHFQFSINIEYQYREQQQLLHSRAVILCTNVLLVSLVYKQTVLYTSDNSVYKTVY